MLMILWLFMLDCALAKKLTLNNFDQLDADDYLEKYGYMGLLPSDIKANPNGGKEHERIRQNAISSFQKYFALPITGQLDVETKKKMIRPRCGLQDMLANDRADLEYKWDKSFLRWTLARPTSQIDSQAVRTAINQAFDAWKIVTPLNFVETNSASNADMQVFFGSGEHGDGVPFDGQGSVLAHAYYPKNGRIHFDDDEKWVFNDASKFQSDPNAIDLLSVAIHEIGHALGIRHIVKENSIMYPLYHGPNIENGQIRTPQLSEYDIRAIQELYGVRNLKPTSARPLEPPRKVTTETIPLITIRPPNRSPITDRPMDRPKPIEPTRGTCPEFDAAVTGMDGTWYFFKGNTVWKGSNANGESRNQLTRSYVDEVFPGGSSNGITAAVTSTISQLTLLFQGQKVYGFEWISNKFILAKNFPKILTTEAPFQPETALRWKDANLMLFKGDQFVIWDDSWNKVTFKHNVSNYFPNMPTGIPSFDVGDKLYFLDKRMYRYSIYDTHTMNVETSKPIDTLIIC